MRNILNFRYVIGIDLGGTTVKLGLFTIDGKLLEKWFIQTNTENNGDNIIKDIAYAVENKLCELKIEKSLVKGVGIAVPGPVNSDNIILNCVNLGWKNKDIVSELSAALNMDVSVGNDANMAAVGEMWQGAAKGGSNIVFVTLGTGVGGGVIINNQIIQGAHGIGGEIGHICVDTRDDAVMCNCGKPGCLEKYASATAIINNANKYLASDKKYAGKTVNNAKDVFDLAKSGCTAAEKAINIAADKLGFAFALISAIVDPDIYLIGGGVSHAGDYLINKIKIAYDLHNPFCKSDSVIIAVSELGNDAGIYGSAKLVLDK